MFYLEDIENMKNAKKLLFLLISVSAALGIKIYSEKEIQKIQKEASVVLAYKNKDILILGNCSDSKNERILELIGTNLKEKQIYIHGLDQNKNYIECPLEKIIMKTVSEIYKENYMAKERVLEGNIKGEIVHVTGVCRDLKGNNYELTMSKTHVIDFHNGVLNGAVLSLNKIVSCDPETTGNFVIQASLLNESNNEKENKKQ